ncbi:hypothetical protein BpHYR1_000609 [Brachionus plicatilis]|uniref:Uncharacterized protein n=1 Tax=Brachionus plicatilis TaxID=10195 RepID=A0A3M7R6S0_BRAPC|nr:hypothetical protein BpHYR1_000609 [Brachionus plicatilis]
MSLYHSSETKCHSKAKKMELGEYLSSTSESEILDESFNVNNMQKKNKRSLNENLSILETFLNEEQIENEQPFTSEGESTELKKEVELLHFKIDEIKSILVEMLENTKRKTKNQVWPTEVMWNGKNMLDIAASSWNKYITSLMEILFSEEQMSERVEILKNCAIAKAKPSPDKIEQSW